VVELNGAEIQGTIYNVIAVDRAVPTSGDVLGADMAFGAGPVLEALIGGK